MEKLIELSEKLNAMIGFYQDFSPETIEELNEGFDDMYGDILHCATMLDEAISALSKKDNTYWDKVDSEVKEYMNEIMIIVKNGENDYTLWVPDIPNDDKILNALFAVHANSGYSVRGTLREIKEEII